MTTDSHRRPAAVGVDASPAPLPAVAVAAPTIEQQRGRRPGSTTHGPLRRATCSVAVVPLRGGVDR